MSTQLKWNWIKKDEFVSHIQAQGWNVKEDISKYDGYTFIKAWKNDMTSHSFEVSKSGYIDFIWTNSNRTRKVTTGYSQLVKVLKQMNISVD